MSIPEKTSTRWKHLATTSELDSDGILHTSLHVVELNSGEDFVVSLSGRGEAASGYFIGALMAATAIWKNAAGEEQLSNTTLVPSARTH